MPNKKTRLSIYSDTSDLFIVVDLGGGVRLPFPRDQAPPGNVCSLVEVALAPTGRRAYQRKQQPPLAERLGEAGVQWLITTYRRGATAAELTAGCGCSVSTVKRLLRTSGVRLSA